MSLNWNVSKVRNFENVCYVMNDDHTKELHPITNVLIWATMMVDLGTITNKNIAEWRWRITFLRRWDGYKSFGWTQQFKEATPDWEESFSPFEISAMDLDKHIGLSTNVANLSRASWLKKMMKYFVRETNPKNDDVWNDSLERYDARVRILKIPKVT